MSEGVRIAALDGHSLGAQVFAPKREVRAIAVVAPAMAVVQRIYRAFAGTLSRHGIATVTFDYRGLGESAPARLPGFAASITDWATLDLPAVIDFARSRFGEQAPTFVVGHSIGGQILGLCPRAPTLAGAVLVASQSGYWKHWSGVSRALMFLHWHVMPAVARVAGYLPMQAIQQGENVPLGAALEWAKWGRHHDYVMSSAGAKHRELAIPIRSYAISDDRYAPPSAVAAMNACYAAATVDFKALTPEDLHTRAIGHFGIFRREFRESFHADVARWMLRP